MAFTGVNRANVAVTDTFDTWRIRTNEVNTTLNLAAAANTADTLVYRDNLGSANLNVLNANSTIVTHTGASDTAFSVVSAVAAQADGSYASILTTGGIYGTLSSKFAADLTVGTNLTVNGNIAAGSDGTDALTFNATLTGNVVPTTNTSVSTAAAAGSMLGSTAKNFAHIYNAQQTITASSGQTTNVFSITSAAPTGNSAVLVNNALTTGTVLQVLSTSTDTSTRKLVQITNDAAAATGTTALSIQADAGRGVYITSTLAAGLPALDIDSSLDAGNTVQILADATTSGSVLEVSADGLTTGKMIDLSSTGTIAGAGRVLNVTADSATTGTGIFMTMDGLTTGKMIDLTSTGTIAGNGRVIDITADSATTGVGLQMSMDGLTTGKMVDLSSTGTIAGAGRVIDITADSLTTGFGIDMSVDALTTGSALRINSSSTHSGNLVSFISDGAATGPTLYVRNDATSSTVKALQIANTTADIFSVTVAGDATIANDLTISGDFVVTGNLSVAGATSEINTTTTIVKDKTLVLGTQSAVTAGATYTLATPPVVTSASHGLSTGDIIFLVTATGTGLTSSQAALGGTTFAENIVKVTVIGSNSFSLQDKDGNNIVSNSTGTLSWVGPQTDALVDDAGIYVPGDTAVHSFKWDDTDNYWETNASFNINDTGQLVLPKGTTAQKPAAAATATVPAATTGAIRYNSSTSKIEAVITSTSYENMSTETFATAIAIALG
jgi:hypothetical protein